MTIIKRIAYTASLLAALTASLTSCDIASDATRYTAPTFPLTASA